MSHPQTSRMREEGSQRKVEDRTRIILRPIASPLPLAFFAFGIGSLLLSASQLGLIPTHETHNLAFLFGFFGFPLQAVAAIFSFLGREPLGATALGLISCSWLANAAIIYTSPPNATTVTFGIFQVSLAIVLAMLGVVGLQGKPLISAIILFATVRYGMNGVYELSGMVWTQAVSGVFGCVVFLFALYGGLALALEDAQHRPVLPFGRCGEALEAVEGDLGDQVGLSRKRPEFASSFSVRRYVSASTMSSSMARTAACVRSETSSLAMIWWMLFLIVLTLNFNSLEISPFVHPSARSRRISTSRCIGAPEV